MAKQTDKQEDRSRRASKVRRSRTTEAEANETSHAAITVVGIGASAGGIEALSGFFDAMTVDSGCAFVVVLHLDPKRESEMARILGGYTKMPVAQVRDGMQIAPDHVYVIAPDSEIKLAGGGLQVSKPSEARGQRHPIDVLFASIAKQQRERSVAIVLSGTGSNGTEGLKEIRAQGGMSLVQAPETARFDAMPRSAIAAGLADHVLAPERMPETLLAYIHHGYVFDPAEIEPISPTGEGIIDQILETLRARHGHDFGSYKRNTLRRRIHRRLGLRNIETIAEYLDDLNTNPQEVSALVTDLMISVTGFFRDPEAWQALGELVINPLVAERASGEAVRVWVPACATGEEAYSIAMLLTEHAEAAGKHFDVKVFATDVQQDNLRKARNGVYPAAALADFFPERTRRFFERLDGSFQVTKQLRDMVVFAAQDMLRDPPFSRLDIVSCRNFLIYLEPEAQQRIIPLCHFALRPDGHLFLGTAETIGRNGDLFDTVSKKWRIYQRIGPTRHDLIDYRQPPGSMGAELAGELLHMSAEGASTSIADIARRALVERYAPASVLVDQKGRVVYFHGTTSDYLEQPPGEPTRDLLAMAREGLALKLRGAMREASKSEKSVTVHGRLYMSGSSRGVTMTVVPLPASPQGSRFILVSFMPGLPPDDLEPPPPSEDAGEASSGDRMQEELASMRLELRNTIEHLEAANEELKASNEEATSINEELQSTNEELETSKEELQSFNEELITVNNQLENKIAELERITNDLNNLLAGSQTATLFLDNDLAITWFAPATKELFDLVTSDIGRPITHFARKFSDEYLLADAETVLKTLTTKEAEVRSDTGRWYLRRMLPYRTRNNHIAGVVVTFSDITLRRAAALAVDDARIYAEAIVSTVRQPLLVLDTDLRVQSANPAFYELFKVAANQTEGHPLYDLGNGQWDIPALRALLDEVLSLNREVTDYEVEHQFREIGRRCMLLNARRLSRGGGRDDLILLAIEDVTERREGENILRASEQRLQDLIEALPGAIYTTDAEGRITSYNPAAADLWGRNPRLGTEKWAGSWRMYRPDGTPLPLGQCQLAISLKEERAVRGAEAVAERPDGIRVPFLEYPTLLRDAAGAIIGAVNMLVDITERKRAGDLAERLAAIVEYSDDAIVSKTLEGTITSWNKGAQRLFGYEADEIIGKSIMTLVPHDRREEEADILRRLQKGEHIQHLETLRKRKDERTIWVSLTISPIRDGGGKVVGASNISRDMTERRRADETRDTLMRELNHRVKNTMAVIQAIASQTLGQASTLEEAHSAFSARLFNLAKAHDVLTRESWQSAKLVDIVSDTIQPHSGVANRFRIEGPDVRLAPSTALAISMTLHELSTNAAKYGALSCKDGSVAIVWQIEGKDADRQLVLRWEESGGPRVMKPKRKGFGSRLIERALASELGGEVRVDYASTGLECRIVAPLPAGQKFLGGRRDAANSTDSDSRG
ncbi:PAS domain-containing protein [Mesorhizobium sp. CC13]|uniref:chemotaxis protein CheB n=1 Tax=Mesorhizobium sp. CC13 TaxID=3029194 RepID=UPI003263A84B